MSKKKLVKYVVSGRLSRVKRLLREEKRKLIGKNPALEDGDAWMDEILVPTYHSGRETYLLHLAATIGDERVLRYWVAPSFMSSALLVSSLFVEDYCVCQI